MIGLVLDAISWALLLSGATFCVIGGIGLFRMPDFYARTHAASLGDTMGAGLIIAGLMLQSPGLLIAVKLIFVLAFLWFTGPIATHALVKAAYARGVMVHSAEDAHAD